MNQNCYAPLRAESLKEIDLIQRLKKPPTYNSLDIFLYPSTNQWLAATTDSEKEE